MMDIIANPLYVAYFALLIAVLTAIKVFVPGSEGQTDSSPAAAPATAQPAAPVAPVVAPQKRRRPWWPPLWPLLPSVRVVASP